MHHALNTVLGKAVMGYESQECGSLASHIALVCWTRISAAATLSQHLLPFAFRPSHSRTTLTNVHSPLAEGELS